MTRHIILATVAALALSGCNAFEDDDDPRRPPADTGFNTFLLSLVSDTDDTAEPVEVNDLVIDTSSEDPAQFDSILPPG